jgi:hypothetical protein
MADAAHRAVQAYLDLVSNNEDYELEEYRRLSKQHSEAVIFAINNLRDLATTARREALEEAAKVCEANEYPFTAAAIRALSNP